MKNTILELLLDIRPELDFEEETGLVSDGVLESFDLVAILAAIEDETGIAIRNDDITAENFDSLDAIVSLVERLKND